ncbi:hypothetical protein Bca4012_033970 [Brassica carinata]
MVVYPGRCVAVGVTRGYEILAPPRGDDHPVSDVFWRLRERLSHVWFLSMENWLRPKRGAIGVEPEDTKELDGMGYFELSVFSFEITRGLLKAGDMKKIKRARPVNKIFSVFIFN